MSKYWTLFIIGIQPICYVFFCCCYIYRQFPQDIFKILHWQWRKWMTMFPFLVKRKYKYVLNIYFMIIYIWDGNYGMCVLYLLRLTATQSMHSFHYMFSCRHFVKFLISHVYKLHKLVCWFYGGRLLSKCVHMIDHTCMNELPRMFMFVWHMCTCIHVT